MNNRFNKKTLRKLLWSLVIIFALMNIVAIFHAYKFTHFSRNDMARTRDPAMLTIQEKLVTLLFGVDNPRPRNKQYPVQPYERVMIKSNKAIECWYIPKPAPKGTVVIFHGFSGDKSTMLDRADQFLEMGYSTLLVDFMGSGGSEGRQTTIGYFEAEQVKSSFDYLVQQGEQNIFLFGTSMGSVAVMKAIRDFNLQPKGIILVTHNGKF